MSAQEVWRLHQGLWALVSGQVKVEDVHGKGLPKAMSDAGKTRTAEEALDEYNTYRVAKESEGILLIGLTTSVTSAVVR